MLLCVDPGIRGSGAALFNEYTKTLLRAAYVKNADPTGGGLEEHNQMAKCILFWAEKAEKPKKIDYDNGRAELLVEWMQIYPDEREVNPNTSLLPLIGVVAHLSGARQWGGRISYRPHEWKRSLNGDAMTQRILERLAPEEKLAIEPCGMSVYHNAVDAVGLGLRHLGRLERKRVFPRE